MGEPWIDEKWEIEIWLTRDIVKRFWVYEDQWSRHTLEFIDSPAKCKRRVCETLRLWELHVTILKIIFSAMLKSLKSLKSKSFFFFLLFFYGFTPFSEIQLYYASASHILTLMSDIGIGKISLTVLSLTLLSAFRSFVFFFVLSLFNQTFIFS